MPRYSSIRRRTPVAALRLPDEVVRSLQDVGIERVAHLASKPRASLRLRFGGDVLLRLDQALTRGSLFKQHVRRIIDQYRSQEVAIGNRC